MPVTVYLNPIFTYDKNYCINAVLTKIETNVHYILFKDGF